MSFRITGLSPEPFFPLFGLPADQLDSLGVMRFHVEEKSGFPDRIELRDAEPGETVLLLNHEHLPQNTPYKSSHAIFVREGARIPYDRINEIAPCMRCRPQSLRAFDTAGMMLDANLAQNEIEIRALILHLFKNPQTAFIHAHNARQGCYSARIERV